MEIRKRQLDEKISHRRQTGQQRSELESQIPNLNIAEIIDEVMDLNRPVEELTDRVRRLRHLTSCDNFELPPESATPKLIAFFSDLLKLDNIELLEESTWCLINLFADNELAEIDSTRVVLELNRLIHPSQKLSLLENIFHLIANISTTTVGAIVLLRDLDFKQVERVVEVHMQLISKFFTFSAEILNHHPNPEMEYVRL